MSSSQAPGLDPHNQIDRYQKTLSIAHDAAEKLHSSFKSANNTPELNERIDTIFSNLKERLHAIHAEHAKPRSLLERILIRRPSLKEKMLFSLKIGIEVGLSQVENPKRKDGIKLAIGYPTTNASLKDRILKPIKYGLKTDADIASSKAAKTLFNMSEYGANQLDLESRIEKVGKEFNELDLNFNDLMTDFVTFLLTSKKVKANPEEKQNAVFTLLGKVYPELKLGRGPEYRNDTIDKAGRLFAGIDQKILRNVILNAISGDKLTASGGSVKRNMHLLFYQYLETASNDRSIKGLKKYLLEQNESLRRDDYKTV